MSLLTRERLHSSLLDIKGVIITQSLELNNLNFHHVYVKNIKQSISVTELYIIYVLKQTTSFLTYALSK